MKVQLDGMQVIEKKEQHPRRGKGYQNYSVIVRSVVSTKRQLLP